MDHALNAFPILASLLKWMVIHCCCLVFQMRKGKDATAAESGTCFFSLKKHLLRTDVGSTVFLFHLNKDYQYGQSRLGNSEAAKESKEACSKGSIQRQQRTTASSIAVATILQGHTESTSTFKRSIGIVHCYDFQRKSCSLWLLMGVLKLVMA